MRNLPFKKDEMEQFYRSGDNPWGYSPEYLEVYNYLFSEIEKELPKSLFILDLGCGEGFFANVLLDYFKTRIAYYIGIDISETAIKIATEKFSSNQNIFLSIEDFEQSDNWTKYLEDVNFVIANESLYYCNRPKTVVAKLNDNMVAGSHLMIADSIVRYTTRESPHREFDFELVKKILHNSCFIDGHRWSLKAFLTRKVEKKESK